MEKHEEIVAKAEREGNQRPPNPEPESAATSGGEGGASSAVTVPADLPAAYEKLAAEKQELYDRLLRKQAELENFRKRSQWEKEEFREHATEELIRSLLPTLDGFERALKHRDASVPEPFYQGLEMIYRQLVGVLGRAGLVALETVGKTFDPHYHQAVEMVETPSCRDHEIIEELQRGYKLRHRLLRPAIVKVAVAPKVAQAPADSEEPEEKP